MEKLSVNQIQLVKELLSKVIPDNEFGLFFRYYIYNESVNTDWDIVLNLILKHFPELTSEINKIIVEYVNYAGKSTLPVGTKVKFEGILGEDAYLNGLTGTITHPFAFGNTGDEWVGFISDDFFPLIPYGGRFNVKIKVIQKFGYNT